MEFDLSGFDPTAPIEGVDAQQTEQEKPLVKAKEQEFDLSGFDPLEAEEQDRIAAAKTAVASDPAAAAKSKILSGRYGEARTVVDSTLEEQAARAERDDFAEFLQNAPAFASHLSTNPADAPIYRKDAKLYANVEKALHAIADEETQHGYAEDHESSTGVAVLDEHVSKKIDKPWLASAGDLISRGSQSGWNIGVQGAAWTKKKDSGEAIDKAFTDWSKKLDEENKKLGGKDTEGSLLFQGAQLIGTMVSSLYEGRQGGLMSMAMAAGAVTAGVISAPLSIPLALGAFGLGAGTYGTYAIEGGLSYKDLIENGADKERARLIATGVGATNALIEMIGLRVAGEAAMPALRNVFPSLMSKTVSALETPTIGRLVRDGLKAVAAGNGEEILTEVMQEVVTATGEELGRAFADAKTPEQQESLVDRLLDTAWQTFLGVTALQLAGGGLILPFKLRAVHRAAGRQEQYFKTLNDSMAHAESKQLSPQAAAEAVDAIAQDAGHPTVYVSGYAFNQAMAESGVTIEQLREVNPELADKVQSAAESVEDVEIPMGQYAAQIAGTDLGAALEQHARTERDGISAAESRAVLDESAQIMRDVMEAANMELEEETAEASEAGAETTTETATETPQEGTESPQGEAAETAQASTPQDERTKALRALEGQLYEDLTAAAPDTLGTRQLRTQARYAARMAMRLAEARGMRPEQARRLVPTIVGTGRTTAVERDSKTGEPLMQGVPANKSAVGNNGNFNPADANIYHQEAAAVDAPLKPRPAKGEHVPFGPLVKAHIGNSQVRRRAVEELFKLMSTEFQKEVVADAKGRSQVVYQKTINQRVQKAAKKAGIDFSNRDSKLIKELMVTIVVNDGLYAANVNTSAIGWYDEKVRLCLGFAGAMFPELDQHNKEYDKNEAFRFLYVLATTSNGLKVKENLPLAVRIYREYKRTGTLPAWGQGTQAEPMIKTIADFVKTQGTFESLDQMRMFFMTTWTVKQLELMGYDIAGEGKSEEVRGAAIIGPKIGNGFFANLNGLFDALTMDRWFMRTWGRWRGELVAFDPENLTAKVDRFRHILDDIQKKADEEEKAYKEAGKKLSDKELRAKYPHMAFRAYLKKTGNFDIDAALRYSTKDLAKKEASLTAERGRFLVAVKRTAATFMPASFRAEYSKIWGGKDKPKSLGWQWYQAMKGVERAMLTDKVAPAGSGERAYIRSVFQAALQQLHGYEGMGKLSMADLQAALWYAEKKIYENTKSDGEFVEDYEDDKAPDYANVMRDVALKNGVPKEKLDQIEERVKKEIANEGSSESGRTRYDTLGKEGKVLVFRTRGFGSLRRDRGLSVEDSEKQGQRSASVYRDGRQVEGTGVRSGQRELGDQPSRLDETGDRGSPDGRRVSLRVDPIATWKPGNSVSAVLKTNQELKKRDTSSAAPVFEEFEANDQTAQTFLDALKEAKRSLGPAAACVEEKSIEELTGRDEWKSQCRIFLSTDRKCGFIIKNGDDLVSVFSGHEHNSGDAIVEAAIAAGARRLDCFNTILPAFYAAHGFRPVARLKFNRDYAPYDWDYDFFSGKTVVGKREDGTPKMSRNFSDGEPDIIMMVYDNDYDGHAPSKAELSALPETDGEHYGEPYMSDALKKLEETNKVVEEAVNEARRRDAARAEKRRRPKVLNQLPAIPMQVLDQRLYHGSPYDFDAFSLAHVGEGEGAQAHGWGLYFAKKDLVASRYRHDLSDQQWSNVYDDTGANLSEASDSRSKLLAGLVRMDDDQSFSAEEVRSRATVKRDRLVNRVALIRQEIQGGRLSGSKLEHNAWLADTFEHQIEVLADIIDNPVALRTERNQGRVYEVEAPDDNVLMREGTRLSAQPKNIQDAVQRLFEENGLDTKGLASKTGKQIYARLTEALGSPMGASMALNAAGIEGISYIGREDGECAVVFNDQSVKIISYQQRAFHGSPFNFSKFSTARIGTGEGAQAHGWGLYFALDRVIAAGYRAKLGGGNPRIVETETGRELRPSFDATRDSVLAEATRAAVDDKGRASKEGIAAAARKIVELADKLIKDNEGLLEYLNKQYRKKRSAAGRADVQAKIDMIERSIEDARKRKAYAEEIAKAPVEMSVRRSGRVYEVEIPNDDVMLFEQRRLNEQPPKVREACRKILQELHDNNPELWNERIGSDVDSLMDTSSGGDFYTYAQRLLGDGTDNARAMSMLLLNHGVQGIRYIGEQDGECAVVFSDEAVKVIDYWQSQQQDSGVRGQYDVTNNRLSLTPNADFSTFCHEMTHFYLEQLIDIAHMPNAPQSVLEDVATLFKEWGVADMAAWDAMPFDERARFHERFAYQSEIYLSEGRAPKPALEELFQHLGQWIRDVYRLCVGGVAGEVGRVYRKQFGEDLPELSDEVRRVMDRMIASEEDVQTAENVEGLQPLFDVKPDDMADDVWDALQKERAECLSMGEEKLTEMRAKDEKWYAGARSKKLREIQKQAREARAKVREQVEEEVNQRPEMLSARLIRESGKKDSGQVNLRLDSDALRAAGVPERTVLRMQSAHLTMAGGLDPATCRALLDPFVKFPSVDAMLKALTVSLDADEIIEKETTRRCIEQHSDLFNPEIVDKTVTEALHNEARARMIAHELQYLMEDPSRPARVMLRAAKQAARGVLANTKLRDASVKKFLAKEARASRKAREAYMAGDKRLAAQYKRQQLVYHECAMQVIEAEKARRAIRDLKSRAFKGDKKLSKTYDLNILAMARAILQNTGWGRGEEPVDGEEYLEKVRKYDPETANGLQIFLDRYPYRGAVDPEQMTVADLIDLKEDVQAIVRLARTAREFVAGETRTTVEEAVAELVDQFDKHDPKAYEPGLRRKISTHEKRQVIIFSAKAWLRRVESWCLAMDNGSVRGPFNRFVYRPIADAAARYRVRNAELQEKLAKIFERMQGNWGATGEIESPELNYTFSRKSELIGAILHTGNASNLEKLLVGGRGESAPWGTLIEGADGSRQLDDRRWQVFIHRCYAEGIVTKEDMDAVQEIWDLLEDLKVDSQKAYYAYYGMYFDEIEAQEIVTPFGTYRGGYAPAATDPDLVAGRSKQLEQDAFADGNIALDLVPITQPGFTKSRVQNYHKPLLLDLSLVSSHIQREVRFAVMAQPVKSVQRLLRNHDLADHLNHFDPKLISEMLMPWLKRSAEQTVTTPSNDFGRAVSYLRNISSMAIMVGNLINALQQYTGWSIAANKVPARKLMRAIYEAAANPSRSIETVMQASTFMRARLHDYQFEFQTRIRKIAAAEPPTTTEQIREWVATHGYFLQTFVQRQVDVPVWMAAYNDALARGMDQDDAVAHADSVVRTTQSAFDPESVSRVETGDPLQRMLLVFYNYFDMQLNALGEKWTLRKEAKQYGKFLVDATLILAVPAVLSEAIADWARGSEGDDDDDWWIEAFRFTTSSIFKNLTAMIPWGGNGVNIALGQLARSDAPGSGAATFLVGKNPYNAKTYSVPALQFPFDAAHAPIALWKYLEGEGSARKATVEMLNLTSLLTGVPVAGVKRPAGYLAGVAAGEIQPEDPIDVVKGILSGRGPAK